MRRVLDLVVAASALLFLAPVFLIIGIFIKLDSQGPVFYLAKRVGKDMEAFNLYKFRSMVVNADRNGPGVTIYNDARVTNMGRFLRRTKLDELPQLLNVLKGEMSLVGPRPEDPRFVAFYNAEQRQVLQVKPGITSAASLHFRDEEQLLVGAEWEQTYRHEILPAKLSVDLEYFNHRTLISDFRLIFRTVTCMFQSA